MVTSQVVVPAPGLGMTGIILLTRIHNATFKLMAETVHMMKYGERAVRKEVMSKH